MCKLSKKTPKLNENRGNLEFFGNRGFGIFMEIGVMGAICTLA